ncbi:hypothetical protein [Lolliginicoccus levis]|uniref:hypothetical protein n=1 Tax=Lolliginicoccus levis TaxID=2919542 RepID=UPI00241C38B5|nr:hypothetical protein [Lolliginicoccus levis]
METNTIVAIIVAVVAVLVIAAIIGSLLAKKRKESRRAEAIHLRAQADEHAHDVGQNEAIAAKTAAKARAAQAEADAKAAEAEGLQHQAHTRRADAASAREKVNSEFDRANEIDPDLPTRDPGVVGGPSDHPRTTTGRTYESDRGYQAGAGPASTSDRPQQDLPRRHQPGRPDDPRPYNQP